MYVQRKLNGIVSNLITFGDVFECTSEVIVVITGCPGIPEFYREFAKELHCCTRLPVCVVGHAGQDGVQDFDDSDLKPNSFDLDHQIEHKLDFINNHINKNSKLHIIGHSIGAWILIELLHKNGDLIGRISSINLLFPTLQKISGTTNGKFVNNIVRRFPGLVLLLFLIIQWLPTYLVLFVIKLYLKIMSLPSYYVERIYLYLHPEIQAKAISLASESMYRINELNISLIKKVKHVTNVVYSLEDRWVPMHHVEDLKKFIPHTSVQELNVEHAFVLKSSILVGKLVSELIINRVKGY